MYTESRRRGGGWPSVPPPTPQTSLTGFNISKESTKIMTLRAEAHLHIGRAKSGKEDCISLRKLPNYQVEYAGYVLLKDVKFAVQPSGLKRFRESGQKNVHAFVRGTLIESTGNRPLGIHSLTRRMREAYYNPQVTDTFVDKATGDAVYSCDTAVLYGTKVYYV